jgi:CRP-like cAMP-binding protein
LELRIRIAELTAVIDVIATALRDARAAGLKVTERHERLVADGKAAAGLLRTIARRLE